MHNSLSDTGSAHSSAALGPCARGAGAHHSALNTSLVYPRRSRPRCSCQLIPQNLQAPHTACLLGRPQVRAAERARHAHHGVSPPREEPFVAVWRCDLKFVPRRCWPVAEPLLSMPKLRHTREAALVQKLAHSFAQPTRDVRTGENVEQIRTVLCLQRVVRIRLPFCTRMLSAELGRYKLQQ